MDHIKVYDADELRCLRIGSLQVLIEFIATSTIQSDCHCPLILKFGRKDTKSAYLLECKKKNLMDHGIEI